MCNFCSDKKIEKIEIENITNYTPYYSRGIIFIKNRKEYHLYTVTGTEKEGYYIHSFIIKYCPICGRKLLEKGENINAE